MRSAALPNPVPACPDQTHTESAMSYIMVDIEADGPIPGDYSMICFGAVVVEPGLERTFYGELCPISEKWVPEALAVSGFTREQVMTFPEPEGVMRSFAGWLGTVASGHPMFISDNNGCVLQQIMA